MTFGLIYLGVFCDINLGLFVVLLIWAPVIGISSGLYLPLSASELYLPTCLKTDVKYSKGKGVGL